MLLLRWLIFSVGYHTTHAVAALKTLKRPSFEWLAVWVIFATIEAASPFLEYILPMYFELRCIFAWWLLFAKTEGVMSTYDKLIGQFFSKHMYFKGDGEIPTLLCTLLTGLLWVSSRIFIASLKLVVRIRGTNNMRGNDLNREWCVVVDEVLEACRKVQLNAGVKPKEIETGNRDSLSPASKLNVPSPRLAS